MMTIFVGLHPRGIQEQNLIPLEKVVGLLGAIMVSEEGDLAATLRKESVIITLIHFSFSITFIILEIDKTIKYVS